MTSCRRQIVQYQHSTMKCQDPVVPVAAVFVAVAVEEVDGTVVVAAVDTGGLLPLFSVHLP